MALHRSMPSTTVMDSKHGAHDLKDTVITIAGSVLSVCHGDKEYRNAGGAEAAQRR